MTSQLDALCGPEKPLKLEPFDAQEFAGLKRSGMARLKDATNPDNSIESRFDLAINAAHALCLAALRRHGFRAQNRYIVYQVLPLTLGLGPEVWRVLAKGHDIRNLSEYEGELDVDERIVGEIVQACQAVVAKPTRAVREPPLPSILNS